MSFTHWKLQRAVKLASLNPARLLGVTDQRGIVATGRRADLVALTHDGTVVHTIIGGELIADTPNP